MSDLVELRASTQKWSTDYAQRYMLPYITRQRDVLLQARIAYYQTGAGPVPPPTPPPEGSSRLSIRAAAATQGVSTGVFQTADRARADFRSKF